MMLRPIVTILCFVVVVIDTGRGLSQTKTAGFRNEPTMVFEVGTGLIRPLPVTMGFSEFTAHLKSKRTRRRPENLPTN